LIMVLIGAVLTAMRKVKSAADNAHCIGNIRQITTALRMFATDNGNRFPDPGGLGVPWETQIRKYITNTPDAPAPSTQQSTMAVFLCPGDAELGPVTGSSYDWRDTGDPTTTLAGRPLSAASSSLVLAMEALPGWHQAKKINVGHVDGSCETMDDQAAIANLMTSTK